MAAPTPISASPMLNTLASGTQVGIAKMSVSGPSTTPSTQAAVGVALLGQPAHGRHGLRADRHVPAVGDDRDEVGRTADQHERQTRDGQVPTHGGEHHDVRRDVGGGRRVTERSPSGVENRRTWPSIPSAISGAQRKRRSPRRASDPPVANPMTRPATTAYRMNTPPSWPTRSRGLMSPMVLPATSTTVLVREGPSRGYNGSTPAPQPQESRDPRRADPRKRPRRVDEPATRPAPAVPRADDDVPDPDRHRGADDVRARPRVRGLAARADARRDRSSPSSSAC